MNIGEIALLKDMGLLEAVGVLALTVALSNTAGIIKWIKGKRKKEKECSYSKLELQHIIEAAIDRAVKIFNLKEYKTLSEQMLLADKSTLMIQSIIMDKFQSDKALKDHKNRGRDIRAFSKIVNYAMIEAKAYLKEWVKNNHILTRTDIEFKEYTKDTVQNLMLQVSTSIDKEYYSEDFIIDRETLKATMIGSLTPQIAEILSALLYDIREVAEHKAAEIAELEAENFFEEES